VPALAGGAPGRQVNVMQSARKNYTEAIQAQDADANARLKNWPGAGGVAGVGDRVPTQGFSAEHRKS